MRLLVVFVMVASVVQIKTVRLFQTADGDVKFGNDVQLSDFLRNVHF